MSFPKRPPMAIGGAAGGAAIAGAAIAGAATGAAVGAPIPGGRSTPGVIPGMIAPGVFGAIVLPSRARRSFFGFLSSDISASRSTGSRHRGRVVSAGAQSEHSTPKSGRILFVSGLPELPPDDARYLRALRSVNGSLGTASLTSAGVAIRIECLGNGPARLGGARPRSTTCRDARPQQVVSRQAVTESTHSPLEATSAPSASLGHRALRVAQNVRGFFPLTTLGVCVAAGSSLMLKFVAYAHLDLVALVVAYGALALVTSALLLVLLGAARLAWVLRKLPTVGDARVETQRLLPTGVSLPRMVLVPFIDIAWTWLEGDGAPAATLELVPSKMRLVEQASLPSRGATQVIARRLTVRDVFGLAAISWTHRQARSLTCLPHAGALRHMPLLVSMAGGDDIPHPMGVDEGDRVELRRYAPGDPARFIHWKVFARTRRLMVRLPERALTRARRTVSYLIAGKNDEASAGAARVAIEAGALGQEWSFGADGTYGEADEIDAALSKVIHSAKAQDSGGSGLRAFLERAERTGPASVVLFVPPTPGPWLSKAVAEVERRASRVRIVVATDGIDRTPPVASWRRFFVEPVVAKRTLARDLDEVVRAFARVRAEVVVLDRVSGRQLGDAHRRALGALETSAQQGGRAA